MLEALFFAPSPLILRKLKIDVTKHLVRAQMVYEAHRVLIRVKHIHAQRTQTHLVVADTV